MAKYKRGNTKVLVDLGPTLYPAIITLATERGFSVASIMRFAAQELLKYGTTIHISPLQDVGGILPHKRSRASAPKV